MDKQFEEVVCFMQQLQSDIITDISKITSNLFIKDCWSSNLGTGITQILQNDKILEKAGVNFSKVSGASMPDSATDSRPNLIGKKFSATGVSLVIHPENPFVPTTHMNVRLFKTQDSKGESSWWFGGGFDLTPYYIFTDDCKHWHNVAKKTCDFLGPEYYSKYKKWCDEYFFIPHRNETRGIGGIFFDDLNAFSFETCFEFIKKVGYGFLSAYMPILNKRKSHKYDSTNKDFQAFRRSRYSEFNLVYDRGTLFGIQSKGRIESILMSMPPQVRWEYNHQCESQETIAKYLKPIDWIKY